MFMGTCSGCVQVPTPVYYWNPYFASAYASRKPATFQISDILQLSHAAAAAASATIPKTSLSTAAGSKRISRDPRNLTDSSASGRIEPRPSSRDHRRSHVPQDTVLNFCVKDKCSVPSALEPLQALCTAGPRGYREGSSTCDRGKLRAEQSSQKDLKFGINNILSDGFGKEKQNIGR